jgi:NTE family protein
MTPDFSLPFFRRDGGDKPAEALELYFNNVLPKVTLFRGLSRRVLRRLMNEAEWFSIPGGWQLLARGERGDALYVIATGSLGLTVPGENGQERIVRQFMPGQTVGEFSLVSDTPRSAGVVALRDTEVLRFSHEAFDRLVKRYPVILANLARILVERIHDMNLGRSEMEASGLPRTLAILPITPSYDPHILADAMVHSFAQGGRKVMLVDGRQYGQELSPYFHRLEREHDHVVYLGDGTDSAWTRLCLRQADRVMLVVRGDVSPADRPEAAAVVSLLESRTARLVELVVMHAVDATTARGTGPWLDRFKPDIHHNIRIGHAGDIARLGRHIRNRAVGIVLAGGGARGFAHLGVLRALEERGLPIDIVCGTSMGGIVGATYAMGWSLEEIHERMHKAFVETNPLSDYTIPTISLVRGRKVTQLLEDNFGDALIEDTWRYFFCVSSNLTTGREVIHRRGPLAWSLRASVAIPGIIPPVLHNREVLVDGAVLNNFPADILAEMRRGPVIGVDVEQRHPFGVPMEEDIDVPEWDALDTGAKGGPGIVSILLRSGTINSTVQTRRSRGRVDLLFEPPVQDVTITDWRRLDEIAEIGYTHAKEVLEKADLSTLAE